MGRVLPTLIERARAGDADARATVLRQPEIDPEAEPYYSAFLFVSRDRPLMAGAMVVLPLAVPRDVIERHCRRLGVDEGELFEFVEIVARIDDDFIRVEGERVLAETSKGKGKT